MKALRILEGVMTVILVILVIAVIGVLYVPKMFGYETRVVMSGSMVPANVAESDRQFYKDHYGIDELYGYEIGSLIYVKKVDFSDIKVGDAVTFNLGTMTVTHMVVSIDSKNRTVTTHGIANAANINEVDIPYADIIGKAEDFSISYAGYILDWASTDSAKILLVTYIIIFAIIIFTNIILDKLSDKDNGDDNKEDEKTGKE